MDFRIRQERLIVSGHGFSRAERKFELRGLQYLGQQRGK